MKSIRITALAVLALSTLNPHLSRLHAQGTEFTYSGRLTDNGLHITGVVELEPTLWDAATNGNQINIFAHRLPLLAEVNNGLFTVVLDFGKDAFPGAPRWLQLAVRRNPDPEPFTTLWPRQKILAVPYAMTARNLTGPVPIDGLSGNYSNALTFDNPGNFFAGRGFNLTDLNASQLTSGTVPSAALGNAWQIGGNTGTTPGTHFLGTIDNQPLEFRVNDMRALRLEPGSGISPSPNVIGGYHGNFVMSGKVGSTIGGGGSANATNAIYSSYATIAGGFPNGIGTNSDSSAIGGGNGNNIAANSTAATIAGGVSNDIGTNSAVSAIGGGYNNNIVANSASSTIAGGAFNDIGANSFNSAIGGGYDNNIGPNSIRSAIAGGGFNEIGTNSDYSAIGGGGFNNIAAIAQFATIPGGDRNFATNRAFAAGTRAKANHPGAFVWADSQDADFPSTASNQFNVRANGGARFVTGGAGLTVDGQSLLSGPVGAAQIADGAVLAELLDDDGSGSGLDADLLDGLNSTAFAPAAHSHSGADIVSGIVADARLSANVALLNLNQTFSGQKTFNNAANSFTGNGAGLTSLSASALASGTVPDARLAANVARANQVWLLGGNAGTTPGTHFLGTTDNQPLEIKVNGVRAGRLEYAGGVPNVILGSPVNFVGPGVVGTTIAGGGASTFTNSILASYGAMGGGRGNRIAPGATECSIAGGQINDIGTNANGSTIGGGENNNIGANSSYSTIAGGYATAIGTNSGASAIGGGASNDIGNNSPRSAVGGGVDNNIGAESLASTIAGGQFNDIGTNSAFSAVGGGNDNNIAANSLASTIAGGYVNNIGTSSDYSTIGGGYYNNIATSAQYAIIAGGYFNQIAATSPYATIAGGRLNDIGTNSAFSAIGGGTNNSIGANATAATIGGGLDNLIQPNADYATIPGGSDNVALGAYSLAAGRRAHAQAQGSFVWADSQNADFGGGVPNSVSFRCAGGVRFDSGSGQTATWLPGFLNWSISSDRNLKDRVTDIDTREVLEKVSRLPLTEWSFKGHSQRHIGPMAQDFHALFPLNETDTMIDSGDLQGVALAAIQGLNRKLEEQLQARDSEIRELRQGLAELKETLKNLSTKTQP